MDKRLMNMIAFVLVIIGGLNWGLIGLFNFNLISAIFGAMSTLTRIIYILVGISALYLVLKPGLWKKSESQ